MRIVSVQHRSHPRLGSLLPGLAVIIIVFGSALTLILNRYWLSTAQIELQGVVNATALATARELVSDDLLRSRDATPQKFAILRTSASQLATSEIVAGQRPFVSDFPNLDIQFGREVVHSLTGRTQFLRTNDSPTSVVVTGHCDRASGNPIPLFFSNLTGHATGDVRCEAVAAVSNDVAGLRPFKDANLPAWPITILESSSNPTLPTWEREIVQRVGGDRFSWNPETRRVVTQPDGIDEITVTCNAKSHPSNVCLIDLSGHSSTQDIVKQLRAGWSRNDLERFGEELNFDRLPISAPCVAELSRAVYGEMLEQIGQARIIFLYRPIHAPRSARSQHVQLTRCVGVRLMKIERLHDRMEAVFQPAVIATRMAVVDSNRSNTETNPYIYRIELTR